MKRIDRRHRETGARLRIVLQRVQVGGRQIQLLARGDTRLTGLVIFEVAGKHRESQLDRLIEQIRLGESKHHIALICTERSRDRERLSESEEVVGLVVKYNERTRQSADD